MKRSETIGELVKALAQAQGEFTPALKSGLNPHLKNKYATLDAVIAVIRKPLCKNGLSFVQPFSDDGEGVYTLETLLFHESGEWIGSEAVVPRMAENRGVNALQAFGGSLTYMRRYSLAALLGISSEEDADGSGGTTREKKTVTKPAQKSTRPAAIPAKGKPPSTKATKAGQNGNVKKDKGIMPPLEILDMVVKAKYAKDRSGAARRLGKSRALDANDAPDIIVGWAGLYHGYREAGEAPDDAARLADDELYSAMGADQEGHTPIDGEEAREMAGT